MNTPSRAFAAARYAALIAALLQIGCGGNGVGEALQTTAQQAKFAVVSQAAGSTPFIASLGIAIDHASELDSVQYRIAPKAGTFSPPVQVTYRAAYLNRRGALSADGSTLTLPVFGLYAGMSNQVTLTRSYIDGSSDRSVVSIATAPYVDPNRIYDQVTVKTQRQAGDALGFGFMVLKNEYTSPIVVDTDANLRWAAAGLQSSVSSVLLDNRFVIGSTTGLDLYHLDFDGTLSTGRVAGDRYTRFHHDLSRGKVGLFGEMDAVLDGVTQYESNIVELAEDGTVLKSWDLAGIFAATMRAGGDDPSNFARNGTDWFHMNSVVYDAADDSLIVSSRENFVVKLDYATGAIKWLLGDPTKHWFVDYPSLRALALTVTSGKVPIGQHALSLLANGDLLLFNNGLESQNQPSGTAPGVRRSFSAASAYRIDEQARTAVESWTFEDGQQVQSPICSSIYAGNAGDYLIDYSDTENFTRSELVGLDRNGLKAFDFYYPTTSINGTPATLGSSSWNSVIVRFENMVFE